MANLTMNDILFAVGIMFLILINAMYEFWG